MMTKNIHLSVQDTVLQHLLEEQVLCRKNLRLDPNAPPDLVLGDHVGEGPPEENKFLLVVPPVRLGEVMDRISYILSGRDRLASVREDGPIDLGPYILNNEECLLIHKQSGKELRLTDKERLLLRTLFEAKGHQMDRKTLLQDVWGYAETAETHTLETHLYRLRQKLHEFGDSDFIAVEDGIYRLRGSAGEA